MKKFDESEMNDNVDYFIGCFEVDKNNNFTNSIVYYSENQSNNIWDYEHLIDNKGKDLSKYIFSIDDLNKAKKIIDKHFLDYKNFIEIKKT